MTLPWEYLLMISSQPAPLVGRREVSALDTLHILNWLGLYSTPSFLMKSSNYSKPSATSATNSESIKINSPTSPSKPNLSHKEL